MRIPLKRACVIGWPVAHSLSPVVHTFWLRTYGIEGEYVRRAIEPDRFDAFMHRLAEEGFCGGNVTLPHKLAAFRACARRDEAAERIGAVNTLWFEDGVLCGGNTDGYGFLANVDASAPGWDGNGEGERKALVLGAGGAARAIVWALASRNFRTILIANRTYERALELAGEFPPARAIRWEALPEGIAGATLIANTSSLGMTGFPDLDLDLTRAASGATVCDIVYRPLQTTLLKNARTAGLLAVDGLGMLLHQAVPGFEKWFGVRPEVTEALREEVLRAMAKNDEGA